MPTGTLASCCWGTVKSTNTGPSDSSMVMAVPGFRYCPRLIERMPSLPANGARTILRSICACSAATSALTVFSWASSVSSWALVEAPARGQAARAGGVDRPAPAAPAASQLGPLDAGVQLDQHLPGLATAPDSKRIAGPAGHLVADGDPAPGRDAAHRGQLHLPPAAAGDRGPHRLGRRARRLGRLPEPDERDNLCGLHRSEAPDEDHQAPRDEEVAHPVNRWNRPGHLSMTPASYFAPKRTRRLASEGGGRRARGPATSVAS